MLTTKTLRGRWYQLHQTLSACVRVCMRIVFRLLPDNGVNEPRIYTLLLTNFKDDAIELRISGSGNVCGNTKCVLSSSRCRRQRVAEQNTGNVAEHEKRK